MFDLEQTIDKAVLIVLFYKVKKNPFDIFTDTLEFWCLQLREEENAASVWYSGLKSICSTSFYLVRLQYVFVACS